MARTIFFDMDGTIADLYGVVSVGFPKTALPNMMKKLRKPKRIG